MSLQLKRIKLTTKPLSKHMEQAISARISNQVRLKSKTLDLKRRPRLKNNKMRYQ
jgi:hypothetical protein